MLIYMAMIDSPNDRDKFERIYHKYRFLMLNVAKKILTNHHDAEDAVHQAFISIIENIDKISIILRQLCGVKFSVQSDSGKSGYLRFLHITDKLSVIWIVKSVTPLLNVIEWFSSIYRYWYNNVIDSIAISVSLDLITQFSCSSLQVCKRKNRNHSRHPHFLLKL